MPCKALKYLLIVSLFFPIPAWAQDLTPISTLDLAKIVTGMGSHEARFVETRHLRLLSEPLMLEGELRFLSPDRLEKNTKSPRREKLVVEGEWVTVRLFDRANDRRFRATDDPVIYALLVTLFSILNGEPEKLDFLYRVDARSSGEAWEMQLIPIAEGLAARVSKVEASGVGKHLEQIGIFELTGDSMVMSIEYDSGG